MSDKERRVVVTGIGVVSPSGVYKNVDGSYGAFYTNINAGKSAIGAKVIGEGSYQTTELAAEVKGFDESSDGILYQYAHSSQLKSTPRHGRLALASAIQAGIDGGSLTVLQTPTEESKEFKYLLNCKIQPEKFGVTIAIAVGGEEAIEKATKILITLGPRKVSGRTIPGLNPNKSSTDPLKMIYTSQSDDNLVVFGEGSSVTAACAAGGKGIFDLFNLIKYGKLDIGYGGGAEDTLHPVTYAGFNQLSRQRVLTQYEDYKDRPWAASRPFDLARKGFVLGEAAAVLQLEELELAKLRGAKIYAEILGGFYGVNARHVLEPTVGAEVRVMQLALKDARIQARYLDYINAHAAGTIGDTIEIQSIRQLMGADLLKVAVSSTKSMIGHCMGAAGAVEAAVTVLAVKNDIAPPTINLDNPEDTEMNLVPYEAQKRRILIAASNSFGLDGVYLTLIFGKYPDCEELAA